MKTFLALIGFAFLSSCTCTPYGYRIARPVSPAPLTFSSPSLTYSASPPAPLIYSASPPAPISYSASVPAPITYPASAPAPITYSVSAPAPITYSASAPAPITYSDSAPAPLTYSAPAPLPVEISEPNYKSESYSAPGLSRTELRDDHGQYSLSYITATGIRVRERGYLKSSNQGYIPVKEGSYEYTSPEGSPISYSYKADENGFNVRGFPFPSGPVQS